MDLAQSALILGTTVKAILVIASVLALLYAVVTYGAWYWVTCSQWEDRQPGPHPNGCLRLSFVSPKTIRGEVVSPKNTGSVRTEIFDGFPVLFSIRGAKFEIPTQRVGGDMQLSIRFNEIDVYQHYDSRGGPPNVNAPPIRFSRVSTCESQGRQ